MERSEIKPPSAIRDLSNLYREVDGGINASTGENYGGMLFMRDSLEAADDVLHESPKLVLGVLDSVGRLQGDAWTSASGEQPGKIPHQHMSLSDYEVVSENTMDIFKRLSGLWGGNEESFTNYDSLDSTPLFIRLICRYGLVYGADFLQHDIEHKSGNSVTRFDILTRSVEWLLMHLSSSSINLLEFRKEHANTIVIQNWRDSGSSFIHEDGSQANITEYIAPIDVQGYAYDALILAAKIFEKYNLRNAEYVRKLRAEAYSLRKNIFKRFWMEDRSCFAMGLDRDGDHNARQIETPSSSQGVLLDSRLFHDISDEERKKYICGIVRTLYSEEFITDIGLRCRAKSYARLTGFADYHGSWAVWPKESYDFAKGLRRQGLDDLAEDLEIRIRNLVNISGENYELLYVHPVTGEVDYFPKPLAGSSEVPDADHVIVATNIPDRGQAWTASAILAIKRKTRPKNYFKPTWELDLEHAQLDEVGRARLLITSEELSIARKQAAEFVIDTEKAKKIDAKWNPDWY